MEHQILFFYEFFNSFPKNNDKEANENAVSLVFIIFST